VTYLKLQLTSLGMIVEVASYGAIHRTPAMILAFMIVAALVLTSGPRCGVGERFEGPAPAFCRRFHRHSNPLYLLWRHRKMVAELMRVRPTHLVMPGATANLGHSWHVSTVLLVAFGFYMWPQFFGASFSAKSSDTLRRNALCMPFYSITMPLMFFVGLAATLVVPCLPN
jgi:solute:Na+ symporter, SSS family